MSGMVLLSRCIKGDLSKVLSISRAYNYTCAAHAHDDEINFKCLDPDKGSGSGGSWIMQPVCEKQQCNHFDKGNAEMEIRNQLAAFLDRKNQLTVSSLPSQALRDKKMAITQVLNDWNDLVEFGILHKYCCVTNDGQRCISSNTKSSCDISFFDDKQSNSVNIFRLESNYAGAHDIMWSSSLVEFDRTVDYDLCSVKVVDTSRTFQSEVVAYSKTSEFTPSNTHLPSEDKLRLVHDYFVDYVPRFFLERQNYSIYSKDVILVDNLRGKSIIKEGITAYVLTAAKYRALAFIRFASVRMFVLKSSIHQDEGYVRLHWRVKGLPQLKSFMFWKFLPWTFIKNLDEESVWIDGISTFYVHPESGAVIKHILDKIEVDKSGDGNPVQSKKEKLVQKLARKVAPSAS